MFNISCLCKAKSNEIMVLIYPVSRVTYFSIAALAHSTSQILWAKSDSTVELCGESLEDEKTKNGTENYGTSGRLFSVLK